MITAEERKLIGLDESDPLPTGGINYQLYSFSGKGHDSVDAWNDDGSPSGSWTDKYDSLKTTLRQAFDVEFCPGSLNVRLVHGTPWVPPRDTSARRIRLGVFHNAYALPVILNEKCICIVVANEVQGFDPATSKPMIDPATGEEYAMPLGNDVNMEQIYSPINIRERLDLEVDPEDIKKTDSVQINARLLSGDLLTVPDYVHHTP